VPPAIYSVIILTN